MAAVNARLVVTYEHELSSADHARMVADAVRIIKDTSRVGNVQIVSDSAPAGVLPPGTVLYRLLEGSSTVGKNGQSIKSSVNDPAEFRLSSETTEPNVAFWGISRTRESDGVEELIAMQLGKGWEPHRAEGRRNYYGVQQWWVRIPSVAPNNDDQQFALGFSLEPDGFHFHMPVWLHQHGVHGAIASEPIRLTAELIRLVMGAAASRDAARRRQFAAAETAESGYFTSGNDPDLLRLLKKRREEAEARAKAADGL